MANKTIVSKELRKRIEELMYQIPPYESPFVNDDRTRREAVAVLEFFHPGYKQIIDSEPFRLWINQQTIFHGLLQDRGMRDLFFAIEALYHFKAERELLARLKQYP